MDPTTRALIIGQDVTNALNTEGIPFNNDLTKRFGPDLQMSLGAFQGILNVIQGNINNDPNLHLVKKLNWKTLPGDPQSGSTFSQYYLAQTIHTLILGLDGVISHSPYIA